MKGLRGGTAIPVTSETLAWIKPESASHQDCQAQPSWTYNMYFACVCWKHPSPPAAPPSPSLPPLGPLEPNFEVVRWGKCANPIPSAAMCRAVTMGGYLKDQLKVVSFVEEKSTHTGSQALKGGKETKRFYASGCVIQEEKVPVHTGD